MTYSYLLSNCLGEGIFGVRQSDELLSRDDHVIIFKVCDWSALFNPAFSLDGNLLTALLSYKLLTLNIHLKVGKYLLFIYCEILLSGITLLQISMKTF